MQSATTIDVKKASNKSNEGDWRKRFLIPVIIVALAALVYVGLQQLIVVTVNGSPIFRMTLMKEMESQIGEQVLDSLITKQLIMQAAKSKGINISDDEINEEIEVLKEQFASSGQTFEEVLEAQGVTMDRVREEIRMQLIIEKAIESDLEITEEEIDQFIEQNQAFLQPGGQQGAFGVPPGDDAEEIDVEELKKDESLRESVTDQIKQQKVSTAMGDWIDELKLKADIKYYGSFTKPEIPDPQAVEVQQAPAEEPSEE